MIIDLTPELFRERFALATVSDGGIVVDLETGGYTSLNPAAAIYLEALEQANSLPAAADRAAAKLGLPREMAAKHLGEVAAALFQNELRHDLIGPFTYRTRDDGGCELWDGKQLAVRVDGSGQLRLAAPPESLRFRPFDCVSELAPKLLFSLGVTVLHGSSCRRGAGILGMCGKSRAGKTTTARTLARHGLALLSEDLLVFNPDLDRPAVFTEAEAKVRRWSLEAARSLDSDIGAAVDTRALRSAAGGSTVPIEAIWFLDASRRGDRFDVKRLSKTEALGRLITNGFLGGTDAASWRRYLRSLRAIVAAIEGYEVYLPDGLARLDAAIMAYAANSAS